MFFEFPLTAARFRLGGLNDDRFALGLSCGSLRRQLILSSGPDLRNGISFSIRGGYHKIPTY